MVEEIGKDPVVASDILHQRLNNDAVVLLVNGNSDESALKTLKQALICLVKAASSGVGATLDDKVSSMPRCATASIRQEGFQVRNLRKEQESAFIFKQAFTLVPLDLSTKYAADDALPRRSQSQNTGKFDVEIDSAVILYNMALALHLRAASKSEKYANQALAFYDKASHMIQKVHERGGAVRALGAAVLNNTAQLLHDRCEFKRSRVLLDKLAAAISEDRNFILNFEEEDANGFLTNVLFLAPPKTARAA